MSNGEGTFIWFDLTTPDPQRAMAFYRDLLGWSYTEADRGADGFYRMVSVGERGIGGLISMAELGMPEDDVPAHFMPYPYTGDVDATTEKAVGLGGQVYAPPRTVPGTTRFSVLGDPQGGVIAPMQPLMEGDMPSGDVPGGAVTWYELQSPDPVASGAFYAGLFGFTVETVAMPGGDYRLLKSGDADIAGIAQADANMPVAGWCPYFRYDDIESAQARVAELGGQSLTGVLDVPGTGEIVVAMDPIGAIFGLHKPTGV